MTTRSNIQTQIHATGSRQAGFTLIEVLISLAIFSIGILGIVSSINSVMDYQRDADDLTQATLLTKQKIEEIKAVSANENALIGGLYGFEYLVGQYPTDQTMTNTSNYVRTKVENNLGKFTRTWTLNVIPADGTAGDFTAANQVNIRFILANVSTTWTASRGSQKTVNLSVMINRREILQQ